MFPRNPWHRDPLFRALSLYVSARVVIVIFALILIVFCFVFYWVGQRPSFTISSTRKCGRFHGSFFFIIIIIKASYFLVKRNELRKDEEGEGYKIKSGTCCQNRLWLRQLFVCLHDDGGMRLLRFRPPPRCPFAKTCCSALGKHHRW